MTTEQLLAENTELRSEIHRLKEQIVWFNRQIFGTKSEKTVVNKDTQLELDIDCKLSKNAEEQTVDVKGSKRRKPNRDGKDTIDLPSDLPVERQVIDLSEDEKVCKETGKPLIKIGEEVTSKLACKPGSFYIKQIVRPKYALPASSEGGICIASLPDSLLTRCQADESLLADLLTRKFVDHLPLYRISEILARQGIYISRQTLSQWVMRCGEALMSLYEEMARQVLSSENIFIDETPLSMLAPGKGKTQQAFMWVIVGGKQVDPPYRIYNFRTNRQHKHAVELLKGFKGVLHSDKYGAYETLANQKQFTWCPCWVHIRRKFLENSGDSEFRNWVLEKINALFALEKDAWEKSPEERLQIRQVKEIPIIDELIAKIKERLEKGQDMPRSLFKEALGYFYGLIPYLKNYTLYPWARLDNNVAERAVRPIAIGRKNWLFVGSEDGGESAAVILTLVQTCRGMGINPTEYLEDVMRRLMSHNSQKLSELLPDQWIKSRSKS